MTTTNPTVLFVCVHNAGRSQMAAGFLDHLAGDRIEVLSAGSAPADTLNPAVIEAMNEVGIDLVEYLQQLIHHDASKCVHVVWSMQRHSGDVVAHLIDDLFVLIVR